MAVERSVGIRDAENEAFVSAVIGALVAGLAFGIMLHETGRMESIATLYGQDDTVVAWAFHFIHSFFAGIFFLAVVNLLRVADPFGVTSLERPLGFPVATTVAGVLYGLVLWALLVATLLPLWGVVIGLERPLPYLHEPSLVGLVLFGGVLGLLYGVLFQLLTRRYASAG